ncbi:nitrous oxide reductase family maturation protein NosD [Kistimonas asteriae]|uniref:nitrous oxide reductase family maturation protein NosD n=1 Tax=Kistimonas asteriae TaxID=517724 RepID=UPI001BACE85C|nr:nitrous oxide reductase family maturation protein NosD [Kistimonas asteriae]
MKHVARLLYVLCLLLGTVPAQAVDIPVPPGSDLQQVLDSSRVGDRVVLQAGTYRGNFVIRQSITLTGEPGAVIDGNGINDALRIQAPDVVISNLNIINWGGDLTAQNAGIYVEAAGRNCQIDNNDLKGNAFGIWLDRVQGGRVSGNRIEGNPALRSADRGNGIHLSLVRGIEVRDNDVRRTRDGLYIISSENNRLINNRVHDLRFGIHYMYSHNNEVIGNRSWRNRTGYALMSSRGLKILGNTSEEDGNYGILMNFITYSEIRDNRIRRIRADGDNIEGAEGKALFVYNSAYNRISGNLFADSDLGIHLTAGSEGNTVFENAFVGNRTQVKYVATRAQEWSGGEGRHRGNYWSDYLGWDMNGDGLGDVVYEPNDNMDRLLWKYPSSRLLINSPAVVVLRWVQQQFPVFRSPGVTDSYPLMANPVAPARPKSLSSSAIVIKDHPVEPATGGQPL